MSTAPATHLEWSPIRDRPDVLEVGDVVHVRGKGFVSRAIRWFSQAWGEEPSWASHTAVVLRVDPAAKVIEALMRPGVSERLVTIYEGSGDRLLAMRKPGGLTPAQKAALEAKLVEYKGREYGLYKIALHVLDAFLNNAYFFRRLGGDKYPICSWLAAFAYDRAVGYRFGCEPAEAQPDDILDHCMGAGWWLVWADSMDSLASLRVVYAKRGRDVAETGLGETFVRLDVKTREDPQAILAKRART